LTGSGKGKLLLMILRYINAAMERAHYEIIEDAEPFYGSIPGIQGVLGSQGPLIGGRRELMAGNAIAGPQAGRIIRREVEPW